MKNIRTTLILIFISIQSYGQVVLKSTIINQGNESIPYVNIYLKNTALGVISNDEGIFQISIPEKYSKGILVFSAIGFETMEIDVISFEKNKPEFIKLKPSNIVLDEVVVSTSKGDLTVNQIVRKAFDNYNKNFPDAPFVAKGFLRHTEKTKKEYKWIVEAAIDVYDPGVYQSSKEIKTNVIEIRKSYDNRHLDTLHLYRWYLEKVKKQSIRQAWDKDIDISAISKQEIQKAINYGDKYFTLFGGRNRPFLHTLFSTDLNKIRYYNQKGATLLEKDLFKKFSFTLDTILLNNNHEVYKIKISAPKKTYKDYGKSFVPFGWIYIQKNNFSILEFEYIKFRGGKYLNTMVRATGTKIAYSLKLKFKEINGKMYLNYMSYQAPKLNRFRDALKVTKDDKSNKDDVHYFTSEEVVFTEIITDKNSIEKLNTKLFSNDLFTPRHYNAEFWNNYNILLESNDQKKMINDLEKNVKLKEQYKKDN